jgi:hypothetical protein
MARSRRRCCALAILAGLGVAGCDLISWTRVTLNHPLEADDVAFILPGRTSLDEVVARLGAPDQLIGTRDGFAANYLYRDAKYFRVNLGYPLGFVSPTAYLPHDFALARSASGADTFQVAFDARAVVQYAGFFRGAAGAQYKAWPFGETKP